MPMLAELVDAVVGVDTHRDTHQVEIALPNGAPDRRDHDQQRHHRLRPAAGLDRRPRPRAAAGGVDRGHPQLRHRAGPRRERRRPAGRRVRATQPQDPPRPRQVRPDRRAPGGAGRAAPGRRPAAHPARGRRPRGAAHPARRPSGADHHQHRADQPAARAAAGRRRHRPPATPAARSPTPAWPAWPGAAYPARPAASRPYGTPRSAASPSPCARPPASSRPTAPSCRPSSTTSSPD